MGELFGALLVVIAFVGFFLTAWSVRCVGIGGAILGGIAGSSVGIASGGNATSGTALFAVIGLVIGILLGAIATSSGKPID